MSVPTDALVGRTISHYRIIAPLGAGGMGVVYKAEDLKLGRSVAIKFIAGDLVREPDAIGRFEREARTASALNHPGICTIYDVDVHTEHPFLVMELLDGHTIRSRIKQGPMSFDDVVGLGLQIADALDAAHTRGIVHRDIKPANIFLTPSGQAKLVDFGLAKPVVNLGAEAVDSDAGTLGGPATRAGTAVGTLGYMSPEQALGQGVDVRTDLFSLGATLYEAVTGHRAFAGATAAAVFDSILHRSPPPIASIKPQADAALQTVVDKLLEKNRELRYQAASELRADLRRLQRGRLETSLGHSAAMVQVRAAKRRWLGWSGAVGIAVVIAATAFMVSRPRWLVTPPPDPVPAFGYTQITTDGFERFPSMSPDGRAVVFAGRRSGNWDIYLQRVIGRNAINLTADSPSDDTHPSFSPDGESIAFRSERFGGGIFVMGSTGESPRRLVDFGYHPSWSPDGRRLAFSSESVVLPEARGTNASLWILDIATGQRRELATGDSAQPVWSPDGSRVAYWGVRGGRRDIWTAPVDGGSAVAVTADAAQDWNPVWSPDGKYLYFASDRGGTMNLWRVGIDVASGRTIGTPEAMTTPASYLGDLSISRDGRRLLYVDIRIAENIHKAPLGVRGRAAESTPLTRGVNRLILSDVSADGQWLACWSRGANDELYLLSSDGTQLRRLTDDRFLDRVPRWSADGARLLFHSNRSGEYKLWSIDVNGEGLRRLDATSAGVIYPAQSPDGTRIAYTLYGRQSFLARATPDLTLTDEAALPQPSPNEVFTPWSWATDSQRIAGWSVLQDGKVGDLLVYQPASRTFERLNVKVRNAALPTWHRRDQLVFGDEHKAYSFDRRSQSVTELYTPPGLDVLNPIPSRDGLWLFFTLVTRESSLWQAELK